MDAFDAKDDLPRWQAWYAPAPGYMPDTPSVWDTAQGLFPLFFIAFPQIIQYPIHCQV